ncbi:MAG: hypothetical protein JJ975_04135 [Bacteroidia bacterium]|nr:hypothetical protein [Bacteroidia bacterium]
MSKRYNVGTYLNRDKDLSIEYGIDIGVLITLSNRMRFDTREENLSANQSELAQRSSNYVAYPVITFNHRLGLNYKKMSANLGVSYGDLSIGSYSERYIYGKRFTVGLAYRW